MRLGYYDRVEGSGGWKKKLDNWIMNPPELEEDDREPGADCSRPGPRGCGSCPGCADYGDQEIERRRDKKMEGTE